MSEVEACEVIDWDRLPTDETYREQVMKELVEQCHYALINYCAARAGETLAEELAQQAFLIVWRKLAGFRPRPGLKKPLEAWLYAIAARECKQAWRNQARRRQIRADFSRDIRQAVHLERPVSPDYLSEFEAGEARAVELSRCLDRLAESDRLILILYYRRGLSVADIADTLGKSTKAVQKQLERARQRLRECITDDLQS